MRDLHKKVFGIVFFILFTGTVFGQSIKTYPSFEDYKHLLHQTDDTTYVINYWATWCAPCIKEMPAFVKLEENYKNKKLKIILTSMDFGNNVTERVRGFMNKHSIDSEVVVLDDPDSNSWIDKVSPEWSGGIPATLIYNKDKRLFFEKEFTYKELEQVINSKFDIP
ncbi:MAG: TlpA disulfide reductase family protein [Bacteroidota bacterium]